MYLIVHETIEEERAGQTVFQAACGVAGLVLEVKVYAIALEGGKVHPEQVGVSRPAWGAGEEHELMGLWGEGSELVSVMGSMGVPMGIGEEHAQHGQGEL